MSEAHRFNVGRAYGAIAREAPGRAALRFPRGRIVTHGALDALANKIATVLRARGIDRHSVVAIVHTKTDECYATMFACLKLGAIYVNLDDQNPVARLRQILHAAAPRIVVGENLPESVLMSAAEAEADRLDFAADDVRATIAAASACAPTGCDAVTGADPAYIMFTSGSTGVPKGAIMTHANVLNFAAWVRDRFDVVADDVLSNANPMYFDNSVFDFYGALLNGASIVPVAREQLAQPAAMIAQLEEARCTLWFSVPSLLIYCMTLKLLDAKRLPDVRRFAFGGEGYPKPELRKLFDAFAHRSRIVNVYGPTECTCICSAYDVTEADLADPTGLVTLGSVAANFAFVVLDDDDTAVTPGGVGELGLLGPQVGLGYVSDAERTARVFTRNPLNVMWDERMYRTGDLVRLGTDGRTLDFVGRKDNQIKHMGYRIELEEIEAALHRLADVVEVAVVQRAGRRETKLLVACYASTRRYDDETLRAHVASLLPPYMVPQRFESHEVLPKNANGKIDRRALAQEAAIS